MPEPNQSLSWKPIRQIAGVLTIAAGIGANVVAIATYLGISAGRLKGIVYINIQVIALLALACLNIILVVYCMYLLKARAKDQQQIRAAGQNIRSLLEALYHDARWELSRYERQFIIDSQTGDTNVTKTYVLRASEPQDRMDFYVEARSDDDLERITGEIRASCRGGVVQPGMRRFDSTTEGVTIIGLTVEFNPPVHTSEHTLSMRFLVKGYVRRPAFSEVVHMALPTGRSVLKFRFNPPRNVFGERTTLYDPTHFTDGEDLGSSHFFREADGEIKWEIANPKFGVYYNVSFEFD